MPAQTRSQARKRKNNDDFEEHLVKKHRKDKLVHYRKTMAPPKPPEKRPTSFLDLPRETRQQILHDAYPQYITVSKRRMNYHICKEIRWVSKLVEKLGQVHEIVQEDVQFVGKKWSQALLLHLGEQKRVIFGHCCSWKEVVQMSKSGNAGWKCAGEFVEARNFVQKLMDYDDLWIFVEIE